MKYKIIGDTLPAVILTMTEGESVFTQSGGMAWMTDGFEMKTNMEGGLFGGIMRKLSEETLFMTSYTCKRENAEIAFASSFPGKIIPLELKSGESIICQKKSLFMRGKKCEIRSIFQEKTRSGSFWGRGLHT